MENKCLLCNQGDPAIPVKCWYCDEDFHLHKRQLAMGPENCIIIAKCPNCHIQNCWKKKGEKVIYSGVVSYKNQPVLDLRGRE